MEEETVEHIVNCVSEEPIQLDATDINCMDEFDHLLESGLISIAARISQFLDLGDY